VFDEKERRMKYIVAALIALLSISLTADRAWSEPDTSKLPEESQLALDLLIWLTEGNPKFDSKYGGEAHINSKDTIFVIGSAFESLEIAKLLPNNCKQVKGIDLKTMNWEKECYLSLSGKQPDDTYSISVVIGTLGREIYSIRVLDDGYEIKLKAIS